MAYFAITQAMFNAEEMLEYKVLYKKVKYNTASTIQ